jgi:arsenite methyltransferase
VLIGEYREMVEAAGFRDVRVTVKGSSACIDPETRDPIGRAILQALGKDENISDYVVSVYVESLKPI